MYRLFCFELRQTLKRYFFLIILCLVVEKEQESGIMEECFAQTTTAV